MGKLTNTTHFPTKHGGPGRSRRLEAPDGHHGQGLEVDICGAANLDVVVHLKNGAPLRETC